MRIRRKIGRKSEGREYFVCSLLDIYSGLQSPLEGNSFDVKPTWNGLIFPQRSKILIAKRCNTLKGTDSLLRTNIQA